jgi:hypothetical protein
MPIHSCNATPNIYDAIWTFVPNEIIDFTKFTMITSLIIECYSPEIDDPPIGRTQWCMLGRGLPEKSLRCSGHIDLFACLHSSHLCKDSNEPFTLPSIKYKFPFLQQLFIQNIYTGIHSKHPVYLKTLTDLPDNLQILNIHNSLIDNIGHIVTHLCPNLTTLRLNSNHFPIHLTYLPTFLQSLYCIREHFTQDLHLSEHTSVVSFVHSTFQYIYPHQSLLIPNPFRIGRFIVASCHSPYDETILSIPKTPFSLKILHIFNTNSHKYYLHFANIPTKLRISSTNDLHNPIIIALHLASNYPRRMAEFFA